MRVASQRNYGKRDRTQMGAGELAFGCGRLNKGGRTREYRFVLCTALSSAPIWNPASTRSAVRYRTVIGCVLLGFIVLLRLKARGPCEPTTTRHHNHRYLTPL